MSRLIGTCLTIGLLCLLSGGWLAEANAARSSYQIKGRPVSDLVDALGQLHRFLSAKFTAEQRCQRQAVVLTTVNKGKTTQFQVADIALARKEEIEKRYNEINVELLRNLYIKASREYLEKKQVDSSLIELLGCLRAGFRNRDAKARSFLNEKELNTVIEQFEAITKQPLKVLIDGDGKRTGLDMQQLEESVKNSISNWVGNDKQKLEKLFKEEKPAEAKQAEIEHHEGHSEPAEQGGAHAAAHAAAHAETTSSGQAQMDEDEQEYLETVFGSLIAVYESLPEQAQLGDRCHTYDRVIQASREEVFNDEFVENLVKEVSGEILEHGPKQGDLMPDEKTREDFLFIAETFDPLRAGPEVWLDLNECLSKWVEVDANVVRYLEDPNHVNLVNQLTSQLDDADAQAYAQASADPAVQQ